MLVVLTSFKQYYQLDTKDCGPSCLRMIAQFYGKSFGYETVRKKCFVSREGVSLLSISEAAESMGFRTVGVRITWEQFRDHSLLPCIVHWKENHFVVVYDIIVKRKKTIIRVADPAIGLVDHSLGEFKAYWLDSSDSTHGVALFLEPTPSFYNSNEELGGKASGFTYILGYLRPYKPYIFQIFLAMIMAALISLILPYITQVIVDKGIATSSLSLITVLLVAQMFLTLGSMANGFIRSWLMLHTATRVSVSMISDFLCKLMKLPFSFFENRMVGDIMQRIGDYSRIQSFLTGSFLSMLVAVMSIIVYGIVITGYNYTILVVFFIGSTFYVLWVLLFLKKRKNLDIQRFEQTAANQSNLFQLVSGITDIKLNNCEKRKRWEWERIQAKLFSISLKSLSLGQEQEAGSILIDQVKNLIISFIAAKSVIDGSMSLGMMMALQYIMGQLNAPISQFISFIQSAQDASISIERLSEIHRMKEEELDCAIEALDVPDNAGIAFNQVLFQYAGPHSPIILDHISFSIPFGKTTAIVGASGSGKTTILKLIQGLYRPISGEIRIAGIPFEQLSIRKWREKCSCIMQDSHIFSDSIAVNIALSDEHPDMNRVRYALEIANLNVWVDGLPQGYQTRIGAEGHGLSTGQKQRLLIARAVYKDADYCFLDEATNSLDAINEEDIMTKVQYYFKGKTVVIVAHRLCTVKNADNIVVIDKGKVVEQGTHKQLLEKQGYYYSLVKKQI